MSWVTKVHELSRNNGSDPCIVGTELQTLGCRSGRVTEAQTHELHEGEGGTEVQSLEVHEGVGEKR
jgi:hypothetical protein